VIVNDVEVSLAGGAGGECDLIDVAELPTENVDYSKVYRVNNPVVPYLKVGEMLTPMVGEEIKLKYVQSIDNVTAPVIFDGTIMTLYVDTSTYIGYIWLDNETKITLAEFYSMQGVAITDKGAVSDVSEITEDGIYFLLTKQTLIGIAGTENKKTIYEYDGTEWLPCKSLTTDMLVGLWKRGTYFYEFKPDGNAICKDSSGNENWIDGYSYSVDNGSLFMTDNAGNGVTLEIEYVVTDGIPTLVRKRDNVVMFTRVTEFPISTT
jgi:hypothetical protein